MKISQLVLGLDGPDNNKERLVALMYARLLKQDKDPVRQKFGEELEQQVKQYAVKHWTTDVAGKRPDLLICDDPIKPIGKDEEETE